MSLPAHIPPCVDEPQHKLHPPAINFPLRIHIQGPLVSIQKLIPDVDWTIQDHVDCGYLQGGPPLAKIAFQAVYGRALAANEHIIIRDQYLGWVSEPWEDPQIDYYGITFDYLVPENEKDPEVLALNIIEMDNDNGAFAKENLRFKPDPADFAGKKVLVVPRCCQKKNGTQDRSRINEQVHRQAMRYGEDSWITIKGS